MRNNQLSRYGSISKVLPGLSIAGKSFFVLANAGTNPSWLGNLIAEFPNDFDGVPRIYSTIALALANCVANRGDIIYVLPNHTENITSATSLNVNVAGVRIQGIGEGNNRPDIVLTTATTATITVSAANCTIDNLIVDGTGVASVATIFTVTAAGFTLTNNRIITATATNEAGLALTTSAAANQLTIANNYFDGSANAGETNALQLIGGNDVQIRNNIFIGNYTTSLGAINNITTAITNLVIDGNYIANNTASSTKAIVLVSGTTGFVVNNRIAILSGTAPITGAGIYVGGNYYVAAAGVTAGTLV